jgi:hypothetical protein
LIGKGIGPKLKEVSQILPSFHVHLECLIEFIGKNEEDGIY